jgi:hypothetical protein
MGRDAACITISYFDACAVDDECAVDLYTRDGGKNILWLTVDVLENNGCSEYLDVTPCRAYRETKINLSKGTVGFDFEYLFDGWGSSTDVLKVLRSLEPRMLVEGSSEIKGALENFHSLPLDQQKDYLEELSGYSEWVVVKIEDFLKCANAG